MKPTAVIFDIDGTIADLDHRLHLVQNKPKDFETFEGLVIRYDKPIKSIINLIYYYGIERNIKIILLTGRSEDCRKDTEEWLYKHVPGFHLEIDLLLMRKSRKSKKPDTRPSAMFKKEVLINEVMPNFEIEMIYDDDPRNIEVFSELGLPSCQVRATEGRMVNK